jgi:hypothetical protein
LNTKKQKTKKSEQKGNGCATICLLLPSAAAGWPYTACLLLAAFAFSSFAFALPFAFSSFAFALPFAFCCCWLLGAGCWVQGGLYIALPAPCSMLPAACCLL